MPKPSEDYGLSVMFEVDLFKLTLDVTFNLHAV